MVYKKGKNLTNADALSRRDYPLEKDHDLPVDDAILTKDQPDIASMTLPTQEMTGNSLFTNPEQLSSCSNGIQQQEMTGNSLSTTPAQLSTSPNGFLIEYKEITQEMLPQINTIQGELDDGPSDILDARKDLVKLQKEDPYFGPIYRYLSKQILPKQAKQARYIIMVSQQYEILDDRLFHFYTKRLRKKKHGEATQFITQLVIPERLEHDILHITCY